MPTKKDKTMVHILDALMRLETKFDNLAIDQSNSSTPDTLGKVYSATTPSSKSSGAATVATRKTDATFSQKNSSSLAQ